MNPTTARGTASSDLATGASGWALAALSGALMAAPCLDTRLFLLGWVAFVPLLYALRGRTLGQSYLLGVVTGLVFWVAMFYWLPEFVHRIKEYPAPYNYLLALLLYSYAAQAFGLIAFALQWLHRRTRLPDLLTVPVVFVAVFSAFPMLFYLRLGEGQSAFSVAIQAADITGAHGLDFMMALSSVLAYRLLSGGWRRLAGPGAIGALACLGLWFGYGVIALRHWDQEIATWSSKRIGIVQPNDQVSLAIPPPPKGYTRGYPPEMEMTENLARQGAELVVWPEARYKGYFEHSIVRNEYIARIAAAGTSLLFHDLEQDESAGKRRYFNSAVLLDADGDQLGVYRKVKRVAFGEYLPVVAEVGFLRERAERYLGDFLREITPGEGHQSFTVAGMRLVPKICYESAFPLFMAESIGDDGAGKVLAILSQDGWFGETRQPYQHLWGSVLRAVESRVPVVHAINNGPSGVILPSGRIVHQAPAFVQTAFVTDVPYSAESGGSFFSRHPTAFLWFIYLGFSGLMLISAIRPIGAERQEGMPGNIAQSDSPD